MLSLFEITPKKRAPKNLWVAPFKTKEQSMALLQKYGKSRTQNSQDVNDIFRVEVQWAFKDTFQTALH